MISGSILMDIRRRMLTEGREGGGSEEAVGLVGMRA